MSTDNCLYLSWCIICTVVFQNEVPTNGSFCRTNRTFSIYRIARPEVLENPRVDGNCRES